MKPITSVTIGSLKKIADHIFLYAKKQGTLSIVNKVCPFGSFEILS
jgi:hypothetical protein